MRLYKHVWDDHFIGKLRMLSFVAGIDMAADIKPGPPIKTAGFHTADIIRRQILPKLVALVCAHPELVPARSKCDADSVSNSPRINFLPAAIGIEFENARAIRFRGVIGIIRARAD